MKKSVFLTLSLVVLQACSLTQPSEYKISSNMDQEGLFGPYSDPNGLVESHFRNGGLELTIHDTGTYFWILPDSSTPRDISVQVDAILENGDPETGAGVVCLYDFDNDNGIYFEITFDGYYVIYKFTDQGEEYIYDFYPSDLINIGGNNNIAVVCNNGVYEFYVNGGMLVKFEDSSSLGSEMALFAYTYSHPESVVRFDNFVAEGVE